VEAAGKSGSVGQPGPAVATRAQATVPWPRSFCGGDHHDAPESFASNTQAEGRRELIRLGRYDMTAHAMEEMAEDFLTIVDVESAVWGGRISRIEREDPRGKKYVIERFAEDNVTPVDVVGRFRGDIRYLVITVYEITTKEE
jgi:hypothetical protein